MKKRSERRKHCALAVVGGAKKFRPPQTPFPGAQDGQNSISWRCSLPAPIDLVWWRSMHAFSTYRGKLSLSQTRCHKPTDRTDYNTLRRS